MFCVYTARSEFLTRDTRSENMLIGVIFWNFQKKLSQSAYMKKRDFTTGVIRLIYLFKVGRYLVYNKIENQYKPTA